jgi:DNA-3-methyladenine glycosylase II
METAIEILGPWSLRTSKAFWEEFTPAALPSTEVEEIRAVFLSDHDWTRVETVVTPDGRIRVSGPGDLDAATAQVAQFLSLDIDGRGWPAVGDRDPVIADAQRQLAGFRPCGFYSPYEAAVWAVLSQRINRRQASSIRRDIADRLGDDGAFPSPKKLLAEDFDLPGRKSEYLHAVAEAALDGKLSNLRSLSADDAMAQVQSITGLGPFAAELVVIRGANFPDVPPRNEKRLEAEIAKRYGPNGADTMQWSPFRSWASVHLRALAENRY